MPSIKRSVVVNAPFHFPYGNTPSKNILADHAGPKDKPLKVLFLGCGDIYNALYTGAFHSGSNSLDIHLNDVSSFSMARNALLLKVCSAPEFDPNDPKDLKYLWNIWYNTEWSESTRQRFIKDAKEIVTDNIPSHICISNEKDRNSLKDICNRWSSSATTVSKKQLESVRKERQRFLIDNWKNDPKYDGDEDLPFVELVKLLADKFSLSIDVAGFEEHVKQQLFEELCQFVKTGNCTTDDEDLKVCINPTFLDPVTKHWNVHYFLCPFLRYRPILVKESSSTQPSAAQGPFAIQHCLQVLKNVIEGYRSNQSRITLKLHTGDALELCNDLTDSFQVIDTSDLADSVGLANIIIATSSRLCSQSENSLLFTHSMYWESLAPSFSSYVESTLSAPLSMIPTLYGVRPSDPMMLANENPLEVVACVKAEKLGDILLTLKWTLAPPYSRNIQLDVSSPIRDFAKRLQRWCFYMGEGPTARRETCSMKCYTPLTYSSIIRSLADRVNWKDGADNILNEPKLPRPFHLSWKSIQDWTAGREVLEMSITTPIPPIFSIPNESSVPERAGFRLVLIAPSRVPPSWRTLNHPVATEAFWHDIHYIDNLDASVNKDRDGQIKDVTLTFLLPKDHALDGNLVAFILDIFRWNQVAYLGSLMDFETRTVKSEKSANFPKVKEGMVAICKELEERYELSICVPGNGIVSGLNLQTEHHQLCESSHELEIFAKKPREMKLHLSFVWPFIRDSIETETSDNVVRLVLKKSFREPWPAEFHELGWQVQQLVPWSENIKNVSMYTMAQFSFPDIVSDVYKAVNTDWTSLPSLDLIRMIIKYVFDGHPASSSTSDTYVTIFTMDKVSGADYPDWLLRVHYPIRRTPSGSPIVVISAYDQRLSRKLISQGKISKEKDVADVERLMLGGHRVSQYPVATLHTHTEEQAEMLRYVLRRNSCKFIRTAWQQKNLPLGANQPWLATFLTPLYTENQGSSSIDVSKWTIDSTDWEFEHMCARCAIVHEDVKRCARCKLVKYCSVRCQRADWPKHKLTCTA